MLIDFIVQNMGPLMFLGLFSLFLLGVPIAFALAATGLIFGAFGISIGVLQPSALTSIPENLWARVMSNDTLLAIPFFTFMGIILEKSGMAEKLLDTMGKLFGPLRGGLAYAIVFVGALLAATTGIVAASVMTMGLIALPVMQRYEYNHKLAAGTIAASGTLAQIIPPSLVLIVLADQLGRPVGDMYAGAMWPSMMLVICYCAYIAIITWLRPDFAPAIPPEGRRFEGDAPYASVLKASLFPLILLGWGATLLFDPMTGIKPILYVLSFIQPEGFAYLKGNVLQQALLSVSPSEVTSEMSKALAKEGFSLYAFFTHPVNGTCSIMAGLMATYIAYTMLVGQKSKQTLQGMKQVVSSIVPPLILIFLVLGTIFQGIATPTEGGAMGAIGAMILAIMNKRLNKTLLIQALKKTVSLSTFVVFILIGARIFSLVFYSVDGHLWIEHLFSSLPGGVLGFLIIVNLMIFFLAFFLDFFELVFIVVPLLAPVASKLGIDLVWFGVALAMNIQTSFMHPPFGFSLFYLRSVAPTKATKDNVTGRIMPPITTAQIYAGAIPYLGIQLLMVGVVILFPSLVITKHNQIIDTNIIEKYVPESPRLLGSSENLERLLLSSD